MKTKVLLTFAVCLLTLPALAGAQASPDALVLHNPDDARLLQNPELDGAVVSAPWLRGQFRYQKWDVDPGRKANAMLFSPTFAIPLGMEKMEVGGRTSLIIFDPDGGSNETGMGDVDLWGKYQIIDDPILLSAGILFTLPTGSEKVIHPWATGEFNFEGFGAMRYYLNDTTALIGHLSLRYNADMDVKVSGVKYEVDGEVSFGIGGGAIVEVTPELNVMGELIIETESYKDTDNNIEITGEAEYFVNDNISINGGIGVGLDDWTPEFEVILGLGALL